SLRHIPFSCAHGYAGPLDGHGDPAPLVQPSRRTGWGHVAEQVLEAQLARDSPERVTEACRLANVECPSAREAGELVEEWRRRRPESDRIHDDVGVSGLVDGHFLAGS